MLRIIKFYAANNRIENYACVKNQKNITCDFTHGSASKIQLLLDQKFYNIFETIKGQGHLCLSMRMKPDLIASALGSDFALNSATILHS